jgi:small GTP-binding protein
MKELSKKVILLGNLGVGKTSLVNRFVFNRFSESYFSTIGVRIEKKTVEVDDSKINMIIWDIAGERNQENTPQSYLLGTNGIMYVVDISNPASYQNAATDISFLKKKLPSIPILLIANKVDLITAAEKATILKSMPISPDIFTSAKSNQNVELIFDELGRLILLNS